MTYLELYPRRANPLTRIKNSLGKVVELTYGTSVEHLIRDGDAAAWSHRLPQAMQTLDGITTYDELSGVRQTRTVCAASPIPMIAPRPTSSTSDAATEPDLVSADVPITSRRRPARRKRRPFRDTE